MKKLIVVIIFLASSGSLIAKEIKGPPPVELLLLEHNKVFEGEPIAGAHGLREYCYVLDNLYVIYSVDLLGEGYEFYKSKPSEKCIPTNSKISANNKLGITVGIPREQASGLLGMALVEGVNVIVWHYQRPIHNLPYDDMTTLTITVKNGLVHSVKVFNTITS